MVLIIDWTIIIGFLGMTLILLAFILNVFTKMDSADNVFLSMNLVGSVAMVVYSILIGATPSLILNGVWALSAAWGLVHHTRKRRNANKRGYAAHSVK